MTVRITIPHNEARLAATLALLDAGTDNAKLQIYGGSKPATVTTAAGSAHLVEIELTKPAGTISAGVLSLTATGDGLIATTGVATWARFICGNGDVLMDGDCSDLAGSGDVKLLTTQLYAGGDAHLASAVLG